MSTTEFETGSVRVERSMSYPVARGWDGEATWRQGCPSRAAASRRRSRLMDGRWEEAGRQIAGRLAPMLGGKEMR